MVLRGARFKISQMWHSLPSRGYFVQIRNQETLVRCVMCSLKGFIIGFQSGTRGSRVEPDLYEPDVACVPG